MRLKLSQSIMDDLKDRDVIRSHTLEANCAPIWRKLDSEPWPKNMTFDATAEDIMDIAKEATWQGWLAQDWTDGNENNWALGQITASKFQVQRCLKLMTTTQMETYNIWKTNTAKGWN